MGQKTIDKFRLPYQPTEVEGECLLAEINTIRFNTLKFIVYLFCSIATAGIPILVVHWFPRLRVKFYFDSALEDECTHVAVLNYDEQTTICQILTETVFFDEISSKKCRYFINRYMKYVIQPTKVVRSSLFDAKQRLMRIVGGEGGGLRGQQVQQLKKWYGQGTMRIEQPSWYQILLKELVRPLYLFLFFSVSLWYYQVYNIYASLILVTTVVAISITVYQLKALNSKIYEMAYYQITLNVLRSGEVVQVSSIDLVPGDIVFLRDPIKIPFEGVILQGSALINQCALTGESVPIVKKADLRENYANPNQSIDKAANVFQGTTIIQVNSKKKMGQFEAMREAYGIPVCVTRTNFLTLKGQLIRIILFPKQQENVFQKQSGKFLICLFFISVLTYFCMIPHLQTVVGPLDMLVKFFDLIAITVPAALPVSMAFGTIYAIEKLKSKSIYCIEEHKVITGGAVNFSCFDKTGTLTEDFMDFQALIPASKGRFHDSIINRRQLRFDTGQEIKSKPYLTDIYNNMASNHSIIRIQSTGEMIGDPMQIKLFEFGEFTLNQSHSDPEVIFSYESARRQNGEVFRRFQFDSDLQRMSVVVKVAAQETQNSFCVYSKGSPEMMAAIFEKSTVPSNYNDVLNEYTSNGFRVLAIGSKNLQGIDYKTMSRETAEGGLLFNGFEIFQNKLKPQTTGAIRQLKDASIGVVMITGDNALTGASISYKCGISQFDQGMIICDYRDGVFYEEKFVYHARETDAPIQQIKGFPSQEQTSGICLGSKRVANIDHFRKPSLHANLQEIILQKSKITDSEVYMRKIIATAISTNSQLCVTGNAFNKLFEGKVQDISELKKQFLECTTVFARTKPNDKAKIVMVYQHTGKTVSMCGDGANDCGALKQADIGLSLSQAEASISAPFTSQIANITSMVQLIKECRAGLATNFSLFNIMASYSLTEYTSSIILSLYFSYPADLHFIFWDIFCNFLFIIFIGYTQTAEKLSVSRPNSSLFCVTNLFQVLFAFALNVIGQICMIVSLSGAFSQTIDYANTGGIEVNKQLYILNQDYSQSTPQTNIIFMFSNFILLSTLIAFNIGQPWKKSFYTNKIFIFIFAFVFIYSIVIILVPSARLTDFMLDFMVYDSQNWFVLGVGLTFGIGLCLLQKLVWEPLSVWLKARYPQKTWL